MIKKSKLLAPALVLIAVLTCAYFFFAPLIVRVSSRFYGLDVSYKHLAVRAPGEFNFSDLKVKDVKRRIGFFAKHADVKLVSNGAAFKDISFNFDLKNVFFIPKEKSPEDAYDSLIALITLPFSGRWEYAETYGNLQTFKGGVRINRLFAKSDDVKLLFSGDIYFDDTVECKTTVYFSDRLVKMVPRELAAAVLNDEGGGWKSISADLKGNARAPTIQVASKLFRLNIGVKNRPSP